MSESLRIVVSGLVGFVPLGGVAWDYLQYVVGLARLGHDVYYYENTAAWTFDPRQDEFVSDGAYAAKFIDDFFRRYAPELADHWHYVQSSERRFGMSATAFRCVAHTTDIFLNVSGAWDPSEELAPGCVKVFLDTDPGYNQIVLSERFAWVPEITRWCGFVAAHDQHFTYAENIAGEDCLVPKLRFRWKTTRMPMVIDLWEGLAAIAPPSSAPYTTLMTWNGFKGKLNYRGVEYKSKGSEFEKYLDLPGRTRVPLAVGVGLRQAPVATLRAKGWQVLDGPHASLTPADYQSFIARSRGEFSTAKHVYAALKTGWFSCRSACYLAAGRPVVVQDTGFTKYLPTGQGLLAFSSLDEAAAALERVESDYEAHCRAARELGRAYFDSRIVLCDLLKQLGV